MLGDGAGAADTAYTADTATVERVPQTVDAADVATVVRVPKTVDATDHMMRGQVSDT
jgi:hypothetical protein